MTAVCSGKTAAARSRKVRGVSGWKFAGVFGSPYSYEWMDMLSSISFQRRRSLNAFRAPIEVAAIANARSKIRHHQNRPVGCRSVGQVASIGDGAAFIRGRDFAAWLGLVPKQMSTGDRTILGSISRRGNRYLRTLFVQGARSVLFRHKSWTKYRFARWLTDAVRRLPSRRPAGELHRECGSRPGLASMACLRGLPARPIGSDHTSDKTSTA